MLNVTRNSPVQVKGALPALALGALALTFGWLTDRGYAAAAAEPPSPATNQRQPAIEQPASTPPVAVIYAPTSGALYFPGDTIQLLGFATDAEDGTLSFSAISWRVLTVVCTGGGSCAESVFFEATGAFATMGVPNPSVPVGSYFFSRVEMTATDLDGDKTTVKHILGPDADANGCMDAFVQKTVFLPPFTLGAADHIASGNAQNAHIEFTDISNPALHATVSWAHVDTYPGTAGQEISFGVLATPFSLSSAGDFSVTFDTDLFAQLAANASGTASGSSSLAVYGGVLSSAGVMIGDIELLQLERAYDDLSGSNPNVAVNRAAHPYGFTRTIPPGSYHLMLVVATEAGGNTPQDQPGPSLGDSFAISMTRVAVLCERRAPLSALAGERTTGYRELAALSDRLSPGLRALGDRLSELAVATLREHPAGARALLPAADASAMPSMLRDLLSGAERNGAQAERPW